MVVVFFPSHGMLSLNISLCGSRVGCLLVRCSSSKSYCILHALGDWSQGALWRWCIPCPVRGQTGKMKNRKRWKIERWKIEKEQWLSSGRAVSGLRPAENSQTGQAFGEGAFLTGVSSRALLTRTLPRVNVSGWRPAGQEELSTQLSSGAASSRGFGAFLFYKESVSCSYTITWDRAREMLFDAFCKVSFQKSILSHGLLNPPFSEIK